MAPPPLPPFWSASPNSTYGALSLPHKFLLILILLYTLLVTPFIVLYRRLCPVYSYLGFLVPPTWTRDIMMTFLRTSRSLLPAPSARFLLSPSSSAVNRILTSSHFSSSPPSILTILLQPSSSCLRIIALNESITLENADVVIYFLHGGAYTTFETAHFLTFILRLLEGVERQGVKAVVVALEYPLAPEVPFPGQVKAAVEGWRWVVGNTGDGGERVAVMGDSAGGNLCLGMMVELASEEEKGAGGRIRAGCGMFLLSPWLTFSTAAGSFRRNRYRDMLALPVLHYAVKCFRGSMGLHDPELQRLVEFLDEPDEEAVKRDWSRILGPETKVWVHAGGHELLLDDIAAWVQRVRRSEGFQGEVKFGVEEGALHDPIVLECMEAWPESRVGVRRWLDKGEQGGMELVEGLARSVVEFGMHRIIREVEGKGVFDFGKIEGLERIVADV